MARVAARPTQRRQWRWEGVGIHALLLLGAVSCLVPFAWMLTTSLKEASQVFTYPPEWIPNPLILGNYEKALTLFPFPRYLLNTVIVTTTVTASQVVVCSLAAYAFARLEFRGRDKLFLLYLGTMMIPGQVTMIPNFILMRAFGFIDTLYALTVPHFFGSAFGTFLLRQFFLTIPRELEDAATLDGSGHLGIYTRIILPLSTPALATLGVFVFMGSWNEFLWPLILINSDRNRTLTVGLVSAARSAYNQTDWGLLMAGATFSLLPILAVFFAAQRYFVRGITMTGIKG